MQNDSPSGQQGLLTALHALAVLQVFQAKLLQSLEGKAITQDTMNDLPPRQLDKPRDSW